MTAASAAVAERIETTGPGPATVPAPIVTVAPTINPVMDMIRQAVADGQPLDVIRELKSMAKEFADEEAARAFSVAFANFKAEVVTVHRNREVTDGPLKGRRYAELFSFVDAATPALSKHGLSASWSVTRDEKDWIEVTCTIEHALGGKKQTSQGGPPDAGGAKNLLQARISTVTYLERATFKAICGLAEQGDDDDGASAGAGAGEKISQTQIDALNDLIDVAIEEVGGKAPTVFRPNMLKHLKVQSLDQLPAVHYQRAIDAINSARPKK
jgi:hypothetical protein